MKTEVIDYGFDVSVRHEPRHTVVSLNQDDYECCCQFLSLRHLERTIESLIAARNWCRLNADEHFKTYAPDRYEKQFEMAEFVDKEWSKIKR